MAERIRTTNNPYDFSVKTFRMKISRGVYQTVHEMKVRPEFFQMVWTGDKPFDVQLNDREYQIGDKLWMLEFDPIHRVYTGRECFVVITSVVCDPAYCKEDHVILGFAPANRFLISKMLERGKADIRNFVIANPDCFHQFLSLVNSTENGAQRSRELAVNFLTERAHGNAPLTAPIIFCISEFLRLMEGAMLEERKE